MATSVLQRPYRGSRVSSFYPVKSLPPIASLDSAFQLQEYISLLIRLDVHDVDAIVSLPGRDAQKDHDESLDPASDVDAKKSEDAYRKSDVSVDRACWVYEQLRRLAQDLSHPLITMLQQECTRSSCPQMKAGEWLYLCVAHGNDGAMEQCCAIDYILHTVDSATALLNSPRAFPSRLSIPQTSHRHFSSLARRLGRIFAHAYFHHREAFEQAEAESSLYARFLKLTNQFDLVPAEFLVIPENAIHHDGRTLTEEVEPPRLFSAAVHPANHQNDTCMADTGLDMDQPPTSRPRTVDGANQFGTDSPRRLGRNRTDTMVFSDAFSVAEELSRNEDGGRSTGGSLLDTLPPVETQSLVSGQSWPGLQTRTEDLDDEDIGDAHSESTLAGPLSPPVEELSLISLEDTSGTTIPNEAAFDDWPSGLSPHGPDDNPTAEPDLEEPIQAMDATEENAALGESSPPEVVEHSLGGVGATPSEVLAESVSGNDDSLPSSSDKEPYAESELSSSSEPLLELNEPPPSEPIPPESESDITDEVGELDGDEVRDGGEEASNGEQNLVGQDGAAASRSTITTGL